MSGELLSILFTQGIIMKIISKSSKLFKGFTLVELLIVIAIIAILSTIAVIGYTQFIKEAAVSADTLLANQINTHLSSERVYRKIDNDNSIAKIVQSNIDSEVTIETQSYDMDIYYNTTSQRFEVLSDSESESFKNLQYYLNLITFTIDETYFETFFKSVSTFENTKQDIVAYVENGSLYINIYKNEHQDTKIPTVDLSKIIYASNVSKEKLEVKFESDIGLKGTELILSTPGKYEIKYSCQNLQYTMDVYVNNIYWSKNASVNIDKVKHEITQIDKYKIKIDISNTIYGVLIKDYLNNTFSENFTTISEQKSLLDNIDIILEIDGKTQTINMQKDKFEYSIVFESVDLDKDNTISITYVYQGYNGVYCYDTAEILVTN